MFHCRWNPSGICLVQPTCLIAIYSILVLLISYYIVYINFVKFYFNK